MYSNGECHLNNSMEIDTVLHCLNKEGNKSIHILINFLLFAQDLRLFFVWKDFHNLMILEYFTLHDYL